MSVASARLHAKANLAELLIEKSMISQTLAQEELRLNIDIAKAQAREKVFADADNFEQTSIHDINNDSFHIVETDNSALPDNNAMHNDHIYNVANTAVKTTSSLSSPTTTCMHVVSAPSRTSMSASTTTTSSTATATWPNIHHHSVPNHIPITPTLPSTTQLNPHASEFSPIVNNDVVHQQISDIATALALPLPEVPKFMGDPLEFNTFMLAFNARIVSRTTNSADRLYYLQQHLDGEPNELIGGCFYMDPYAGYREAMSLLYNEYGDSYKISTAYMNKIHEWSTIKHDDCKALRKLSFFLIKCQSAMMNICDLSVLNHAPNLQCIVHKLPVYLQNKWRDTSTRLRIQAHRLPQFSDLVCFIRSAAESANDPIFSQEAMDKNPETSRQTKTPSNRQQSVYVKTSSFAVKLDDSNESIHTSPNKDQTTGNIWQCYFCNGDHDIDDCNKFKQKSVEERHTFIKYQNRCFGCFGLNHISNGCMNKRTCMLCGKRHPTCLHIEGFQRGISSTSETPRDNSSPSTNHSSVVHVSSNVIISNDSTVLQAIIPVIVYQKGSSRYITTYAFYDQGSNGCFITDNLKDKLTAVGTDTALQLKTMHGESVIKTTSVNDLVVTDTNNNNAVELPMTYTRSEIPVTPDQIPEPKLICQWPYLKHIAETITEFHPKLSIGLLIGSNCPLALEPIEVVNSECGGPYAIRYRHGWTFSTPLHSNLTTSNVVNCNRVALVETEYAKEVISQDIVTKILDSDFIGSQVGKFPRKRETSQENLTLLRKVAAHVNVSNDIYLSPLLNVSNKMAQVTKRAPCPETNMPQKPEHQCTPEWPIETYLVGEQTELQSNDECVTSTVITTTVNHNPYNDLIHYILSWLKLMIAVTVFILVFDIILQGLQWISRQMAINNAHHEIWFPFNVLNLQRTAVRTTIALQH
jgi:hypothetical protein